MAIIKFYTYLNKPAAKSHRFVLICIITMHKNSQQTEIQITITIQPTLLYDKRHRYLWRVLGIQISRSFFDDGGMTGRIMSQRISDKYIKSIILI